MAYDLPIIDFSPLARFGRTPIDLPATAMPQSQGLASLPATGASINPMGAMAPVTVPGNTPASIRYNNPGAQYPGQSATAFGSTGFGIIGGGHKIAKFDTPEQGAAAQFDLMRRKYTNIPLSQAITTWSGGNSSPAYISSVSQATGLSPNTIITPQLLQSPAGITLAKAMARFEAGREFPLSDAQWERARGLAFGR